MNQELKKHLQGREVCGWFGRARDSGGAELGTPELAEARALYERFPTQLESTPTVSQEMWCKN